MFVALKMLKSKKKFRRQGLIEIQLMERLREGDPHNRNHCITILNRGEFRGHLFIITNMLSCDLYALLAEGDLQGLDCQKVVKITYQCLMALDYAETCHIIHADIKPENILLETHDGDNIQVIDWGSGAFSGKTLYSYIQSRFYRAPEVMFGFQYDTEIDIWSCGCVIFELITGYPLFQGSDEQDQIGKICEVLGLPPANMIVQAPRKDEYFWEVSPGQYQLRTRHKVCSRQISAMMGEKGAPRELIDIVEQMVNWEPNMRALPAKLLQENIFSQYRQVDVQQK